jgi:restriction system protein
MAIPSYQALMAPVLRLLADGQDRSTSELRSSLATELGYTRSDRELRTKSGEPLDRNRLNYAVTYLLHAGLVSHPRRGFTRIEPRGLRVLQDHPDSIDRSIEAYSPWVN